METIVSEFPEPQSEAESEKIIAAYLTEMLLLSETMRQDQAEIDRIKIDTKRLKTETRATLDRIRTML